MNENSEEKYARNILEAHNFKVIRLSNEPSRCADYSVQKGLEKYLVEVTDKKETEFIQKLRCKAEAEGIASDSRVLKQWNRIDAIVRNKKDQLKATPDRGNAFLIIWLSALHHDSHFVLNSVLHNIYGLQDLFVFSSFEAITSKPCFYYHKYYSFYQEEDIDAVILAGPQGGRLCVNEFSRRASLFRKSELYPMFPEKSRYDPLTMEYEQRSFRIIRDQNRRDEKTQWSYLFETYGVKTTKSTAHQFVGYVSF
jgi:hypothetical protein